MSRLQATALCAAFVALGSVVALPPVSAQQYPTKPVKIIVSFSPGGGNDIIARFAAHRLSTSLGQQFIVENKPGAGGRLGIAAGVHSEPDGYTLTLIASGYTVHPSLYTLTFDPVNDITPIIQLARGPLLVLVHPSLPAKSINELIALARSNPGKLTFASTGQGASIHLATEFFANLAGVKMTHVPYKGMAPALTDTIAGHTDICFSTPSPGLPHIKSGRLRALAVTATTRLDTIPDVPTVAESGLPGYEVTQWYGLAGPKGLPRPIVDRINHDLTEALKLNDTLKQFDADGVAPSGGSPEQFTATIKKEIALWKKIVNDAGIKVE